MRILSWHGYLLAGSGSNIYNANTARAWRAAGHDVLLMCQERDAAALSFVDEAGDFTPDNSELKLAGGAAAPAAGRCRVARPNIGGLLPVYVYDDYEGFEVKTFPELNDAELERYVSSNVAALATAIAEHDPDAILVGHEVMGPYIASIACADAGKSFLAKLHGSALEWAVKRQARYLDYATKGLGAARAVVGGSEYMVNEAARVIPGWRERAAVVNPGCDVELFRPALRSAPSEPRVGFVGKLIAPKGVHNLLGALGFLTADLKDVVIVGYGSFEGVLVDLWKRLHEGEKTGALDIALREELDALSDALRSLEDEAAYFDRLASTELSFAGRLDHGPLSKVLPGFDVLVVPSVGPEAFGMVAAEAAACGVLPLVPRHSGIGEVGTALERELGRPGLLTFDPKDPMREMARQLDGILSIPWAERQAMGAAAVDLARRRWSWEHVADELLARATGG